MASFNKWICVGNLCKDPELREVGSTQVAQMRLAVNENYTSKTGEKVEKTVFVDVEAWDKSAANCAAMVCRGCSILVEGKLQMDEWEDKDSGEKRSKLKVRADRVVFLTFKDKQAGGGQAEPQAEAAAAKPAGDEEIPF